MLLLGRHPTLRLDDLGHWCLLLTRRIGGEDMTPTISGLDPLNGLLIKAEHDGDPLSCEMKVEVGDFTGGEQDDLTGLEVDDEP